MGFEPASSPNLDRSNPVDTGFITTVSVVGKKQKKIKCVSSFFNFFAVMRC